jgi:hypothetical protein
MKVTVRKCPFTNKLFETDGEYRSHLSQLRKIKEKSREVARKRREFNDLFVRGGQTVIGPDEFIEFIRENWKVLTINAWKNSFYRDTDMSGTLPVLKDMRWGRIHYSTSLSNSHSCPRGGTTNWGSKPGLPSGYPGWRGMLEWTVEEKTTGRRIGGSDLFSNTVVHTGTGGGGGGRYQYDVTLWAADWPAWATWQALNTL